MFEKKLFHQGIEPRCTYCARGALIEKGKILCPKKGLVLPDGHCAAFRYDPLKRVPPKPVTLDTSKLTEQDFQLT